MLGPFPADTRVCPLTGHPLFFYPSFVVPKSKPGAYRWVLNASYDRGGASLNDKIYEYSTKLVGFKESIVPCLKTSFMSRIDLKKAFKQLFRTISQMYLLGTVVDHFVFIDATMSMGLKNTCKLFEEDFMKAFVKGLIHHHPVLFTNEFGPLVGNYLDDIWFIAPTEEKNTLQLLVAEWWAKWLGIELNDDKRELPRTSTRHLGFQIDLRNKIVSVTAKHRQRCISFFDLFMACVRTKGRIPTKKLQKILGLQIWISTVFRVMRQFLTSTCDILRISRTKRYFYPRKHQTLMLRMIFDLKM